MNRKYALMIVLAFVLMFSSIGMFSQAHANTTNPDRSLVPKSTGNMDPILDVNNPPGNATTPVVPNTPNDQTIPGARTFDRDNVDMQPRTPFNDDRTNDTFRTRNTTNASNNNWTWLGLLGLIGLFGLVRRDRAVDRS